MPLSELDLGKINVGQNVTVKLDAFKDSQFRGKVNRIAPTANPSSRQIPVEIVINNPRNQIKGGLLARVSFASEKESYIVVPKIAIIEEKGINYIFTVNTNDNDQNNVIKRKVVIGDRINDKVEIISGISAGEKYVVRSSKPLNDRDLVGLSIISK
ncbi:MAG: efflux RND transporter periplasmic adaptor subunit [Pleurocapsa sp.]